jgi:hypothetical protein
LLAAWKTYQGVAEDGQPIPRHLHGKILNTRRATGLVDFLTVHYYLHIPDKAMDDLEDVCNGFPSLVLCQSVQHLDQCLHFFLANKLLNTFFFIL